MYKIATAATNLLRFFRTALRKPSLYKVTYKGDTPIVRVNRPMIKRFFQQRTKNPFDLIQARLFTNKGTLKSNKMLNDLLDKYTIPAKPQDIDRLVELVHGKYFKEFKPYYIRHTSGSKSVDGPKSSISYDLIDPYKQSNYTFGDASLTTAAHQLGHNISQHRRIIDYAMLPGGQFEAMAENRYLYRILRRLDKYNQQVSANKIGKYLLEDLKIGRMNPLEVQRALDTYRRNSIAALTGNLYFQRDTKYYEDTLKKALRLIKNRKDVAQARSDVFFEDYINAYKDHVPVSNYSQDWKNGRQLTWFGNPLKYSYQDALQKFGYPKVPFDQVLK